MKKYIYKDKIKRESLQQDWSFTSDFLLVNFKGLPLREKVKITRKARQSWGNASSSKPKNRCFYGCRARAVYSNMGLGRHAFLKKVGAGLIPGYTKFSK